MLLFVDHLTVIDCSYLHPEYGILGESWIVDVALEGALDAQSMVMDFGHVKKRLKALIDETVDHTLLVPKQSEHLLQLEGDDTAMLLHWKDQRGRDWQHQSPAEALCVMDTAAITTESVTVHLTEKLMQVMPETVEKLHLTLHHEPLQDGLYYHYSHGLKKHDGNCQRIAHGHRSKLEIWKDDVPALAEMTDICSKWAQIYLVSQSDVVEETATQIVSAYDAPQGYFRLSAPRDACDLLPQDSTVERIAEHLAQQLKAKEPKASWRVKAYEGVRKGAIA